MKNYNQRSLYALVDSAGNSSKLKLSAVKRKYRLGNALVLQCPIDKSKPLQKYLNSLGDVIIIKPRV
jgi:hypothetical protein